MRACVCACALSAVSGLNQREIQIVRFYLQFHIKLTVESLGEYIAVYATDVNANGKFLSVTYFRVSQGVL